MTNLTPEMLEKIVSGDLSSFQVLLTQPHESIVKCRSQLKTLKLTKDSVIRVLDALKRRAVSEESVQMWASFVRRGYVASRRAMPVSPIDIEFDALDEARISDAIARLDELGDAIEGVLSADEIDGLLTSLRD
jgi:hypothetical protein